MAVNSTAIWRVRPSGSNTNGGGYDPGISGAATDYSQQNAAQASGSHGTATGTTTFTDTVAANFTSAMVGNAIWIASGAGFTVGAYFVVVFNSSTSVVLDRSPGTGTVAVWNLGGGWADYWTNTTSSGPLVGGNQVLILGSGTPNPASYTYDYDQTANLSLTLSNPITFANDPATPGYLAPPNTTGGMPVIKFDVANALFSENSGGTIFQGLWFVGTTTAAGNYVTNVNANFASTFIGCVLDQFSFDLGLATVTAGQTVLAGCEIFSSVVPGSAGTHAAVNATANNVVEILLTGCNIHDCVGVGIIVANDQNGGTVINSIIAKCQSDGMQIGGGYCGTIIQNCTIDGNLGNGIKITNGRQSYLVALNNIISNQTGAGKSGISSDTSGVLSQFIDYNVYYNNTSDLTNLSYSPHDTHGGSNPYVGQSTENYQLS